MDHLFFMVFVYVFLMEVIHLNMKSWMIWASGISHDLKPPKGISWDDFNDGLPSPEIMFFYREIIPSHGHKIQVSEKI